MATKYRNHNENVTQQRIESVKNTIELYRLSHLELDRETIEKIAATAKDTTDELAMLKKIEAKHDRKIASIQARQAKEKVEGHPWCSDGGQHDPAEVPGSVRPFTTQHGGNPAASGCITVTERCAKCGRTRKVDINGKHRSEGLWRTR